MKTTIGKAVLMCCLVISLSISATAELREYNLTYDQVGNLIQGFDQHYEYNEFNQLARVRELNRTGAILEEYVYDHEGNRLKKYESQLNQTTYYFSDNFIKVVNSSGTFVYKYYYDGDTLIGRKDPDNKKFFYHPDILGSTDLITNESGSIVEETTYEPHGEVIDGGQTSEFLYTSKELDDQTGLYYFGARYYDPFFMHFTQPDETVTDIYNPQDLNRYAYVRNNPYKYIDPDGETPWDIIDIGFIAYGAYRFARDPSWSTAGNLGLDVGFAVLPIVPNLKRIKEGVRALDKVDDVKDVGKAVEKTVPNPYGKLGGPEHRAEVARTVNEIESRGLRPKTEFAVKDPITQKPKRFVDVAALNEAGKPIELYQVGRTTQTGMPVARERRALADITRIHKDVPTKFKSYRTASRSGSGTGARFGSRRGGGRRG